MNTNSKGKEDLETKDQEFAVNSAENTPFIFGNGKLVTPQKHETEVTPVRCRPDLFKSPLNFSTVTVEQLGITPESFVKNPPGKASCSLKKARRRSAIGARGSPETNHLICFIAQQRNLKNAEKSPLAQNSPFQGSPVLHRNVNPLRERISAFQSAFHSIKENENMADCPEFSEAKREFETTDYIKNEGLREWQQSGFSAHLPSKRRRLSCQSRFEGVKAVDWVEAKGSSDAFSPKTLLEDKVAEAEVLNTIPVPDVKSPVPSVCKKGVLPSETIVLRSVLKKPSSKLFLESVQEHSDDVCDATHSSTISNVGMYWKEQKADDQENCNVPALLNRRKRKRVTFGEDLTPEVFDESLPANTPLRKGGTPVRKKDSSNASPLQLGQSPIPGPLAQPNFDDKGENLENIEPLQVPFPTLSPKKASITDSLSGTDSFSSSNNLENVFSDNVGRMTRTSNRRNQLTSFGEGSICNSLNTETQPCKEKKITRRTSQEPKQVNKAPSKKNPFLKTGRKKKGKRKQSVKKSLYGEREMASKKPLLSPIPEIPEISEGTPSAPGIQRVYSDNFNSNGKLKEVLELPKSLTKRKTPLPQIPKDLNRDQHFDKRYVSEICSTDVKSTSLHGDAAFKQHSNLSSTEVNENETIPKKDKVEEGDAELKIGTETENHLFSCISVTEECILSDDLILQSQEFAAGKNVENFYQVFKIPEDRHIKRDDLLAAVEGKPKCNHLMSDTQKEDVLIGNVKETRGLGEDSERNPTGKSEMTCVERKHRRRSMHSLDSQNLHWRKNENHSSADTVRSSVEIHLENPELCQELSDAIEQTFMRNKETKVRRSTRLQKDLKNEGLVWISLPFPPTSCTSQKTKRRTICTSDSKGFENLSPKKETASKSDTRAMPASMSGKETSQGPAGGSAKLPGKRRMSFCTSSLTNRKNTTQHTADGDPFLARRKRSSQNGFEKTGHTGELNE
ncbi:cell division cycle-associated protein 2 [Rhynchocyon petersi]